VVWNPLVKVSCWLFFIIVILLALWRIFIRPMVFETFKVRKLYLIIPDSPMKTQKIRGCHKVICTKRNQRQSLIGKFFIGSILFLKNDFWEQDMEIVPRDKKSVRIRPPHNLTVAPGNTLTLGINAEATNNQTNKKAILKIN
jgi:hypothetical protein